jgi:hypothetical protein
VSIQRKILGRLKTSAMEKADNLGLHKFGGLLPEPAINVDSATIAEMYHIPCLTVRGDGSTHEFSQLSQVQDFMGSVAKTYFDEGNRACSFDELAVIPIGGECALATLKWTLRTDGGTPIQEWRQTYNLIRTQQGWKFLLSTFHRP